MTLILTLVCARGGWTEKDPDDLRWGFQQEGVSPPHP